MITMATHRLPLVMLLAVLLAGCASGPSFKEMQDQIAPQAENTGRIYVYRTQTLGLAVQPDILLNGENIGSCTPGGVFFRDVSPGKYEAAVSTEVERQLTMTVSANDEKYVRCYISFGFFVGHANLELVDPTEARAEIQDLSYVHD
jgi:hypothetical protein